MSDEASPFGVVIEMDDGYVGRNGALVAGLSKKNPPDFSRPGILVFRFRAPKPICRVATLAPGCTLRDDECLSVVVESLQPLENKLLARLRETSTRHDEPEDTGQDDNECYQPSPDECNADFAKHDGQGSEARASFDPAKPEIVSESWGMDYQRNESQPATNASERRYRRISLRELLERTPPPDESICKKLGLSLRDRPMGIVGYSGSGKTWIANWFELQLATGRPLFGNPEWTIDRPYRVLHLDYEMNWGVLQERYSELCQTEGIDYIADVGDRLDYGEHPDFYLNDPDAEAIFERETEGAEVIVIDAFRPAIPGESENDSMIRRFVDMVRRLSARTGKLFVFLLHVGHAGRNQPAEPRGTSAVKDASGAVFSVYGELLGPKTIENTKMGGSARRLAPKFGVIFERVGDPENGPMSLTFKAAEQAAEKPKTETIEKEEWADTMRKILIAVKKDAGKGKAALYKKVGGNRPTFDTVLQNALRRGLVENRGTKDHHEYHIAPPGQKWLDDGERYRGRTQGPNVSTIPDTSESPAPDDAPPSVDSIPAPVTEQANENAARKNQSDGMDANIKTVVEYIRDNPGCTKSEVNEYVKLESGRVVAVRDKAQREGLISWSVKDGNVITAKGREVFGLTPLVATAPPNAREPSDTSTDTPDPAKGA